MVYLYETCMSRSSQKKMNRAKRAHEHLKTKIIVNNKDVYASSLPACRQAFNQPSLKNELSEAN